MFKTNALIQNGEYGINEYNDKLKKTIFKPLGKAIYIESITRDIENNSVKFILFWDYLGEPVYFEFTRGLLSDYPCMQELIDQGADVTKKTFPTVVDTLRLQELDIEASGIGSKKVYSHLGWKTIPVPIPSGGTVNKLCYRADTLIGPYKAKYIGPLKVNPMGTFEAWKAMVEKEIIGHIPGEVVMLASLYAVVNGLISAHTTGENPLVHISGYTGSGKTTIAMAGASAYGEPFDGSRTVADQLGNPVTQHSCYGSWSATENAVLGRCAGNRGCLIVLNELGKFKGSDMSSILYNMSEGSDKLRMNKKLEVSQLEGYSTTILSVGEHSLLDRCQSKADGLRIRVLELDMKMTKSSESADRIKAISRKNNGWAAPMLAEYIINNGGIKMVLDIYHRWRSKLLTLWPDTPSKERFISKFPALFLTTAELAKAALGITFSEQDIVDFFLDREGECGNDRNLALSSYDMIISQCRIHMDKFFIRSDKSLKGKTAYQDYTTVPRGECWGRVTNKSEFHSDGRIIAQEFEVRKETVENLLAEKNFENKKSCIAAWKEAGVLDVLDDTHPCRKRKIDPSTPDGSTEPVYVFRIFCDPADAEKHWDATVKGNVPQIAPVTKLPQLHVKDLMKEADEDGTEDAYTA